MKLLPLPLPLKGLNSVIPDVPFDSGYAREFTNCAIINARVIARPALYDVSRNTVVTSDISWFDPDALTAIVTSSGNFAPLTAGASSPGVGGACLYPATTFKHASIEVLCGCREPRHTSDPFASHGFTSTVITMTSVNAGCSYQGRPYFTDGTTVVYGDIGQVTGAIATDGLSGGSFVLTSLLGGQKCIRLFAQNALGGNQANTVFVAFGSRGKVLVFRGGWPDSDDWALIGDYNMPQPSSSVSFIEIDGDLIIGTKDYPYSFQDLLTGGVKNAFDNRISAPIENLWRALSWDSDAIGSWTAETLPAAFYLSQLTREGIGSVVHTYDALCFRCSSNIFSRLDTVADYGSDASILIYFRQYKAWAIWFTGPYRYPIRLWESDPNQGPIGTCNTGIIQFISNRWVDEANGVTKQIYSSWKTPFASIYEGKNQKVSGIRTFFIENSDTASHPTQAEIHKIRTLFDYSDQNTPWGFWYQPTASGSGEPGKYGEVRVQIPRNSSGAYSTLSNPGGVGGCVSFQFVLTENSTGAHGATDYRELFAATALIEDGGVKL